MLFFFLNLLNYLEKMGDTAGQVGQFPTPKLNRPFSLSYNWTIKITLSLSSSLSFCPSHSVLFTFKFILIHTHTWNDRWHGTSSSRIKEVESGMPMPSHKFIRQKSHFFHGEECVMGDWKSWQIFLYIHRNGKNWYKCFL